MCENNIFDLSFLKIKRIIRKFKSHAILVFGITVPSGLDCKRYMYIKVVSFCRDYTT